MKVGIVGSGMVGATAAYAMVLRRSASEIILVDRNTERAAAEAADILHAVPFVAPADIAAGDYADLEGCGVVILAAGVSQSPGESRLELLTRNARICRDVVTRVLNHAPRTILLVAVNPVDIMTHLASGFAAEFGVEPCRVFGSGTTLDTARLRTLLGAHLGVDAQHVHGFVIGEHGDSEVIPWSCVGISSFSLEEFARIRGRNLDEATRQEITRNVRDAAYQIIQGKGSTYYGIGAALARIVDVIAHNRRAIATICSPQKEVAGVKNVTLSLPHLVGGRGAGVSLPLDLSTAEQEQLQASARLIRDAIDAYEAG